MSAGSTKKKKPATRVTVRETERFQYRSIDDVAKKQILENQRRGMESQHYEIAFRIETLQQLSEGADEAQKTQYEGDIESMRAQLEKLEGMIGALNDELLDLNENINNEQEGQ